MMMLQLGTLFAQAKGQQDDGAAGAMAGLFLCIYFVLIVALVVIQILFLLSMSKCLAQCSRRNRTMEPGQVWLNLIPFFNIVWMFITIIRISESLKNEYRSRGLRADDPEFGKMMGITYMVLSLISCFPINMIFQIIYWMKIAGFKNQLMSNKGGGGIDDDDDRPRRGGRRDDNFDDEDDDRPRRRRDED